jgi:gas vesicle protein
MAGTRDFISGVVWGGLVGAAIGMLMAPRSGEETRALLRERSDEFKMQARETADNLRQTAEEAKSRAGELQQRGKELIDENRERIVRTAEAVKQSAKEAAQATPAGTGGSMPAGAPGQGGQSQGTRTSPMQGAGQGMPQQLPAQGSEAGRADMPARPATTPGQGPSRPQGGSGL